MTWAATAFIHRYGYIRYHCRYGSMGYDNPYLREKKVVPRLAGGRRPDADSSGTGSLDTLSRRSGAKISSRQWKAFSRRYMSLLQNRCIKVIYYLRPDIVSMDNEWYWWLACSYPPRDRQLTRNKIIFRHPFPCCTSLRLHLMFFLSPPPTFWYPF